MKGALKLQAAARKSYFSTKKNVVVVDGCRIPFTTAGSVYNDLLAVDLGRYALKGLLVKTALDPSLIDYIYYGTVIQEPRTSNIAREAALNAGIPFTVPSHTISMACISSNQAITSGVEKILSGKADIVVAGYRIHYFRHYALIMTYLGGCETFSDVPIRFSKPIRQRLLQLNKVLKKGTFAALGLLKGVPSAFLIA
jgi:acetyl-CoA acyltransferase